MKKMGCNEIRKSFTDFFESKGHYIGKSSSLIPKNDKSLLLINSGMAPLKNYFSGVEVPPSKRMTTCQKCIRTGDIENVGKTARHGTFFEMMGNFSFGDYFKEDAIKWAWEFVTKHLEIPEDKIWATVYLNDDEAHDLWLKYSSIPEERIVRLGKDDNFWEIGLGPCGPCSELYYDRGEQYGCDNPDCKPGCDCDRYLEFWNLVFTQFDRQEDGSYPELAHKNIDTGMGLERMACIMQGVDTIFDVDTIKHILNTVEKMANVEYGKGGKTDVSIRIITDHIRAVSFLVADGVLPSNEGRGYVLRRLLRRAARHGRLLGIEGRFLSKLCETVIEGSKDGYPELEEKKEFIIKVISEEEDKFNKTIDQGLSILADMEKALEEKNEKVLSGEDAFKLYDTYGFPIDLTKEILEEKNITIDEEGFTKCMNEQREKARKARKVSNYMGADATVYDKIDPAITSEFVGYDKLKNESKVTVLTTEEDVVEALSEGDKGTIIVDETVFYATMGGQEGDKGYISTPDGEFRVDTTIKLKGGKIGHVGTITKGMIKVGDVVTLSVDPEYRADTCKNHSATHILQKALRTVLGNHVEQKGSYVDPERLRFDFTHFQSVTADELKKVEDIVNEQIANAIPVETKIMSIEEAKKTGAMALFGEKYGENVRVVCMGDFSKEFCGGTHVANTANIRLFKIVSESGVAAGVRRIEALTDKGVLKYYEDLERLVKEASEAAKTESVQLVRRIHTMNDEIKALSSENEKLKAELANNALGDVSDNVVDVKGVKFVATKVDNVDMNELRNLGDKIKTEIGSGVVLVVSATGSDKVNMIAMATDDAVAKGAHSGNLIKAVASLVGGGGGGRPNMAQAGGKNPAGIDELLKKAPEVLAEQINA